MKYDVAFDLAEQAPALFERACADAPGLAEAMAEFRDSPILPQDASIGRQGRLYRLPRHNRSYCYELGPDAPSADLSAPTLVVKGAEVMLEDFESFLTWMKVHPSRNYIKHRSLADNIAIRERKIPGAMALHEAEVETGVGLMVHERHLEGYDELARLPLPMLILKVPQERVDRIAALIKAEIDPMGWERIAPHLRRGLGIYVYYYPSGPVRLDQYLEFGQSREHAPEWAGFGERGTTQVDFFESSLKYDVAEAIEGWTRLCARLLWLGLAPATPYGVMVGSLLQTSNVCLDGGACDIDSIADMSAYSERSVGEALLFSAAGLRHTVTAALGLPEEDGDAVGLMRGTMLVQLQRALARESIEGRDLHPTIQAFASLEDFMGAFALMPALRAPDPSHFGYYR